MKEHPPKNATVLEKIVLHKKSRVLELLFQDGFEVRLTCEFLRVYSPSAEVRGHGPGQEVLQIGKKNVFIESIEQVGNYAVKLKFSDGHDTGIYSWEYLREISNDKDELWDRYLGRLKATSKSRI